MRFILLTTIFPSVLGIGKVNRGVSLTIDHFEQIGVVHNKAFDALTEMYSTKRPKDRTEMMEDVFAVLVSLCGDKDAACRSFLTDYGASARSRRELTSKIESVSKIEYPEDFDGELLHYMDEVYNTLQTIKHREGESNPIANVENVLRRLSEIRAAVKNSFIDADKSGIVIYRTNSRYLVAVLTGISVAVESTKLWTTVYSNSSHPLYGLHDLSYYEGVRFDDERMGGRRAQQNEKGDLGNNYYDNDNDGVFSVFDRVDNFISIIPMLVFTDARGAVVEVLNLGASDSPGDIFDPSSVLNATLAGGVTASASYLETFLPPPTPSPTAPTPAPTTTAPTPDPGLPTPSPTSF